MNFKKMERTLVNNDFSQTLGYCYLISFLAAVSILYLFPHASMLSEDLQAFGFLSCVLISLWGYQKTLALNRGVANKDFHKKFFSLSFITGLRVFGGLLLVSLILRGSKNLFSTYLSIPEGPLLSEFSKFLLIPAVFLVFFLLLINAFKRVSE